VINLRSIHFQWRDPASIRPAPALASLHCSSRKSGATGAARKSWVYEVATQPKRSTTPCSSTEVIVDGPRTLGAERIAPQGRSRACLHCDFRRFKDPPKFADQNMLGSCPQNRARQRAKFKPIWSLSRTWLHSRQLTHSHRVLPRSMMWCPLVQPRHRRIQSVRLFQ